MQQRIQCGCTWHKCSYKTCKSKKKQKVESMISSSSQNNQPSSSSSNISNPSAPTSGREITSNDNSTINEQFCSAEALWSSVVFWSRHSLSYKWPCLWNISQNVSRFSIAAGFKCGRTKTNYLLSDGIAVDVQE